MENNEEIINIAKKRVIEKENQNLYDEVRENIGQIPDFNKQFIENIRTDETKGLDDSEFERQLEELQEMYDIQTRNPLETGKRGFAKPIALRLRNNIQNEVRFSLDPIVEKQIQFNSKILNLISKLKTKPQQNLDHPGVSSDYKRLIEKLNDTSTKLQQNIKYQKLLDQLNSISSKHQEQIGSANEKLDELIERLELQQKIIYKLNRVFDQHQDLFNKFFEIKKAKKNSYKKQKTYQNRRINKHEISKKTEGKKQKEPHKPRKNKTY